jgi:hypothetical protein
LHQLELAEQSKMRNQEANDKLLNKLEQKKANESNNKNYSSVSYNLFTLDFSETKKGKQMKFNEDMVKYRATIRSDNLYSKFNKVNPITGQPVQKFIPLEKPKK